jgi:hypothetical protein
MLMAETEKKKDEDELTAAGAEEPELDIAVHLPSDAPRDDSSDSPDFKVEELDFEEVRPMVKRKQKLKEKPDSSRGHGMLGVGAEGITVMDKEKEVMDEYGEEDELDFVPPKIDLSGIIEPEAGSVPEHRQEIIEARKRGHGLAFDFKKPDEKVKVKRKKRTQ